MKFVIYLAICTSEKYGYCSNDNISSKENCIVQTIKIKGLLFVNSDQREGENQTIRKT